MMAVGSGQKKSTEKGLGQIHLLILQSLPKKQGTIEIHSGDIDPGSRPLGELSWDEAPDGNLHLELSFKLCSDRTSHANQPVYASPRKPITCSQLGTRSRIFWSLDPGMHEQTNRTFSMYWSCQQRSTQFVDKNSQFSKYTNSLSIKYSKY